MELTKVIYHNGDTKSCRNCLHSRPCGRATTSEDVLSRCRCCHANDVNHIDYSDNVWEPNQKPSNTEAVNLITEMRDACKMVLAVAELEIPRYNEAMSYQKAVEAIAKADDFLLKL